jgi:hypothetical protein
MVPPIEWGWTRAYFAMFSLLALGAVSAWGYSLSRGAGRPAAVVGALLPFTNFSAAICLSYGQYAVIVSGLMVAAAVLLERRRDAAAGGLIALAFVKPQLAALFLVPTVLRRRLAPVLVVGVSATLATTAVAMWLGTDGWTLLKQSAVEAGYYQQLSHNPVIRWVEALIGFGRAVPLLATIAATLMALASVSMGRRGEWSRFLSVSVVLSMFWTYRKHYDVAMMTIPLVVLWAEAARSGRWRDLTVFLALGITLWLPVRDSQWHSPAVQALHALVWLTAAGVLIRSTGTSPIGSMSAVSAEGQP